MRKNCDCAQEWLDGVAERKVCDWCKHPLKPLYLSGLCRHCYDIKRELKRLHWLVESSKTKGGGDPRFGPVPFELEFAYKIAIEMAESAQWEGRQYGSVYWGDVTALDLEHEFSFISKRFLKKDLYNHDAYLFACFTPSQLRYLLYIISRMSREYLRRNRRKMAANGSMTLSLEEVLANRNPGTFRVEKG